LEKLAQKSTEFSYNKMTDLSIISDLRWIAIPPLEFDISTDPKIIELHQCLSDNVLYRYIDQLFYDWNLDLKI
jgi:hypothetical protein